MILQRGCVFFNLLLKKKKKKKEKQKKTFDALCSFEEDIFSISRERCSLTDFFFIKRFNLALVFVHPLSCFTPREGVKS